MMMPSSSPARADRQRHQRPAIARWPGELSIAEFLSGVLEAVRTRLPEELRELEARRQGSLIKLFGDEPAIHYELWLHRSRGRGELGLHFETRDAQRNRQLLEYVADDLLFLKDALDQGLEAEPWDKGWTRLYLTYPLERLGVAEQARFAEAFATFIETVEPIRREAVAASW
jgi:hypothetical protein